MTEGFEELRQYNLWDGNAIEREYSSLETIADNYEKMVVSLDDFQLPMRLGIKHVQAWNLEDVIK